MYLNAADCSMDTELVQRTLMAKCECNCVDSFEVTFLVFITDTHYSEVIEEE